MFKKAKTLAIKSSEGLKNKPTDPYMAGREEWNERYGNYIDQAKNWRLIALITAITALIALIGLLAVVSQKKYVPYVVEVDKLGSVAHVGFADRASPMDQRIIKSYLVRFLTDWRNVIADPVAQKKAIDQLYSMIPIASPSLEKINSYFRENSPFQRAQSETVAVNIISVLAISDKTWQIEWAETTRNLAGGIIKQTRWKASFTIALNPPQSEELMLINPLGLFVMDLNWSQEI